jgi:hypothetical protein
MNTSIDGNYVINCPNCGHKHYRVVKKGYITDKRFDESLPLKHDLIVLKSATVPYDQRRVRGDIATAREL